MMTKTTETEVLTCAGCGRMIYQYAIGSPDSELWACRWREQDWCESCAAAALRAISITRKAQREITPEVETILPCEADGCTRQGIWQLQTAHDDDDVLMCGEHKATYQAARGRDFLHLYTRSELLAMATKGTKP